MRQHHLLLLIGMICTVPLHPIQQPTHLVERTIGTLFTPAPLPAEELALSIRADLMAAPFHHAQPISIDTIKNRIEQTETTELLSDILYILRRLDLEHSTSATSHYQSFYEQFKQWFLGYSWPTQAEADIYVNFLRTELIRGTLSEELADLLTSFTLAVTEYAIAHDAHLAPAKSVERLAVLIHADLLARGAPSSLTLDTIKNQILMVEAHGILTQALHQLHTLADEHPLETESHISIFYDYYGAWFQGVAWPEPVVSEQYLGIIDFAQTQGTMPTELATLLRQFTQNVRNYAILWHAASARTTKISGWSLALICAGTVVTLSALITFIYLWWWRKKHSKKTVPDAPPQTVTVTSGGRGDAAQPPTVVRSAPPSVLVATTAQPGTVLTSDLGGTGAQPGEAIVSSLISTAPAPCPTQLHSTVQPGPTIASSDIGAVATHPGPVISSTATDAQPGAAIVSSGIENTTAHTVTSSPPATPSRPRWHNNTPYCARIGADPTRTPQGAAPPPPVTLDFSPPMSAGFSTPSGPPSPSGPPPSSPSELIAPPALPHGGGWFSWIPWLS